MERTFCDGWGGAGADQLRPPDREHRIVNGLPATCLQRADPRIWLTDALLRTDTHPSSPVGELTPRLWNMLFSDIPLSSYWATIRMRVGFRVTSPAAVTGGQSQSDWK